MPAPWEYAFYLDETKAEDFTHTSDVVAVGVSARSETILISGGHLSIGGVAYKFVFSHETADDGVVYVHKANKLDPLVFRPVRAPVTINILNITIATAVPNQLWKFSGQCDHAGPVIHIEVGPAITVAKLSDVVCELLVESNYMTRQQKLTITWHGAPVNRRQLVTNAMHVDASPAAIINKSLFKPHKHNIKKD